MHAAGGRMMGCCYALVVADGWQMDIALALRLLAAHGAVMFRTWPWWLTFLLIAASLGWFWLLSQDLSFSRVEPGKASVANQAKP